GKVRWLRRSCAPGRLRLAKKCYNFVFGWQANPKSIYKTCSSVDRNMGMERMGSATWPVKSRGSGRALGAQLRYKEKASWPAIEEESVNTVYAWSNQRAVP